MAKPGKRRRRPAAKPAAVRVTRGRRRTTASRPRRRSAAATWEALFGRHEALLRGEVAFRAATRGGPQPRAAAAGQVEALFGIWWIDPTYPIYYDIIVDGVPIAPPNSARGGETIRRLSLRRGHTNAIDWMIQHEGQGWKNKVFLKFDDQVLQLGSDQDPSDADSDDMSTGMRDVVVP